MKENIFDTPVPGQSLTNTPGNYPWEHAPQYTSVDEASEYVWDRMHDPAMLDQITTFLKNDIPVEAITRMIVFGGFITIPVSLAALILRKPIYVHEQNTILGSANKISSIFSKKNFLGMPLHNNNLKKSEVVGNPIRNAF